MPQTDKELFLHWWKSAWDEGVWAASWSKSISDLTPDQAAWQPPSAPGVPGVRKSIWQLVEHMIFWRENWLGRLDGGPRPTADLLATHNFPEIRERSQAAWDAARSRLGASQQRVAAAVRDRFEVAAPMMYFLPHDCYHFGQVNYIRAMLGLKPIE